MTRTYADALTDQSIRARGGRPYPERITLALDLGGHEGPEVDIACGAVEPAVDRWETGEEIPTMEQLRLLGQLTGFPVGFFFTEPGPRLDETRMFVCAIDPTGGSVQLNGPEQPEQLPLLPSPPPSLPVPKPDTPPPGPLPECSGCERPMRRTTWVRQHGRCSRCGPARATS